MVAGHSLREPDSRKRQVILHPLLLDLFLENIEQFLEIQVAFPDVDEAPHILNLIEECR